MVLVPWMASSRPRPLLLCLRDKFSRRRRRRVWEVKYGYCIQPRLSLLWALPQSRSSERAQWSAHIAVDTIERHYLSSSRAEIKKVDHGDGRGRPESRQSLLVSPSKWVTPNSNPGGFYDRRRRRHHRCRLGASSFQVTPCLVG